MQGFRPCMQDDFACSPSEDIKGDSFGYFAVFDGHGQYGEVVSQYCAENFMDNFLARKSLKKKKKLSYKNLTCAMTKTFEKFDTQLKESALNHSPSLPRGEKSMVDFTFSGSTATVALIFSKFIVVANTGDCRTVLCSCGSVKFSTMDHNPGNMEESKRILAAGGKVFTMPSQHPVIFDSDAHANLAVSRTLGDYGFKKSPSLPAKNQIVSPIPDITVLQRHSTDEFIVLGSDGVFRALSNSEVVTFVHQRMSITDDLPTICCDLIEMAHYSVSWCR